MAWLVSDGSHEDGPFALPGAENPFGLPVLDPQMLPPPAHWGQGPECVDGATQLHHVHDAFDGHGDPERGRAAATACCPGASWCRHLTA